MDHDVCEHGNSRKSAVFILSNGRPDMVITYDTLRRSGYTGKIYIIIDDEDDSADYYFERFGLDNVLVYSKESAIQSYDTGLVTPPRRLGGCARSQCHHLAGTLGLTHFIIADDDLLGISHKYFKNSHSDEFRCTDFDSVEESIFDFLDVSGALAVGLAQGGDFIGGVYNKSVLNQNRSGWCRKCVNMLFCRTDRPIHVYGSLNSDITSFVVDGGRGELYFTVYDICAHYSLTSSTSGGMTPVYKKYGTYVKTFMPLMYAPSCIKISVLNGGGIGGKRRIHHSIKWENCVPMIISDSYRKAGEDNDG